MRTVDRFLAGLCAFRKEDFTIPGIAEYLREGPVDPDSLAPYIHYEPTHYTRNLIYRSDLFELIAICWEIGQGSAIHNHHNQNCWMAVPIGRLVVQNYRVTRDEPATAFCELEEADRVTMDPLNPAHVAPETPIHSVLNLSEFAARATSLHIYSQPYDRCLVYSLEARSYREVPLFYDTEFGRPSAVR